MNDVSQIEKLKSSYCIYTNQTVIFVLTSLFNIYDNSI